MWRGDELREERDKASPALVSIRGRNRDDLDLKRSHVRGEPALADGVALKQTEESEVLVAVEVEACRAGARPPGQRTEHVVPKRLVAELSPAALGEKSCLVLLLGSGSRAARLG